MLEELRIRDVGVIDEATLRFQPGLNVLTGETGAGKTMVVHALELLLGARADADQVRHGAATAMVEGRIRPVPMSAAEWVDPEDDELVVSREVSARDTSAEGTGSRSRARVGGRMAPASALVEAVGSAVEIHGQHESVRLGEPALQRELLDRSGGPSLAAAVAAYQAIWQRWEAARAELAALDGDERERSREVDRLRYELNEIDAAAPEPGEAERLGADRSRLEHAEALTQAAALAAEALGADGGGRDAIGSATSALQGAHGLDPALDALATRAHSLSAEVQDLVFELRGYLDGLELDPARLEALRARTALLADLCWKYAPGERARGDIDTDALLAYATQARAELSRLDGGADRADALRAEVAAFAAELASAADALHREREGAGTRLAATVEGHLSELAMPGAILEVRVERIEPAAHGADRVTFLLAPNPGEPALPLGKAASGGERSRVALAVRLALADADDTPVLVFDEVDAGIGGAVAQAVGRKLAQLARGRQVLCVTHLAQLAAFADAHFIVRKTDRDGRTVADVTPLVDEQARIVELSRMLSGSPDSELAVGHAAELREAARADVRSG